MSSSVSSSTQSVYHSGHQTYIKFTQMNNYPLVATEDTLMHFATYCLDSLNLSYQIIKLYLCGIRYHQLLQGIPNPFTLEEKLPILQMLLNGIKRQQKSHQPSRKPITIKILHDMVTSLQQEIFTHYSDILMSTVCVVAFLDSSDVRSSPANHHLTPNATCVSVISPCMITMQFLKQSKTDPFRKGIDIKLFRTKSTACPIQQLSAYLPMRNSTFACKPNDPLFIMENGNALTRSRFLEMLKQLLHRAGHAESGITGHSFRIGAATSATKARIEDHLIKSMGRWSSDSYLRYIRTADSTIQHAQLFMLHSE